MSGAPDNSGEALDGATVTQTGRPVVVSSPTVTRVEVDPCDSTARTLPDRRFAAADAAANGEFYDPDHRTKWAGIFEAGKTWGDGSGPRFRRSPMGRLAESGNPNVRHRKERRYASEEGAKVAARKERKAASREKRVRPSEAKLPTERKIMRCGGGASALFAAITGRMPAPRPAALAASDPAPIAPPLAA